MLLAAVVLAPNTRKLSLAINGRPAKRPAFWPFLTLASISAALFLARSSVVAIIALYLSLSLIIFSDLLTKSPAFNLPVLTWLEISAIAGHCPIFTALALPLFARF